jgi:hypothetical protein
MYSVNPDRTFTSDKATIYDFAYFPVNRPSRSFIVTQYDSGSTTIASEFDNVTDAIEGLVRLCLTYNIQHSQLANGDLIIMRKV